MIFNFFLLRNVSLYILGMRCLAYEILFQLVAQSRAFANIMEQLVNRRICVCHSRGLLREGFFFEEGGGGGIFYSILIKYTTAEMFSDDQYSKAKIGTVKCRFIKTGRRVKI